MKSSLISQFQNDKVLFFCLNKKINIKPKPSTKEKKTAEILKITDELLLKMKIKNFYETRKITIQKVLKELKPEEIQDLEEAKAIIQKIIDTIEESRIEMEDWLTDKNHFTPESRGFEDISNTEEDFFPV